MIRGPFDVYHLNGGGNQIAPAKPRKCVYDYTDGGICEKMHASCIRRQDGGCKWTSNTNLRMCREMEGLAERR